ncbi:MAG: hypothetical protein RLZZ414_1248 [Bacteroidota bacterium]
MIIKKYLLLLTLPLLLVIFAGNQSHKKNEKNSSIFSTDKAEQNISSLNYYPKREFRAAWVTTFTNLDWPSVQSRTQSSEVQKKEFITLLNQFEKAKINAVIVQVRAAADAFYPSKIVPWSAWLTGEQGKAPQPYYDPLKFMIEECHKRNMEFHAWFNPLRAVSHKKFSSVTPNHISKTKPDWCFLYDETIYFNPGIPEVQQHIVEVIKEVVKNYDVDGIHLDDYFYPYTVRNMGIPDTATYKKHADNMSIGNWRRNNINTLVKSIADSIKTIKPYVKFGVSPYAVWRNKKQDPKGSESNSGQTSYDNLYCDTKLWMDKGWLDYIAPQLYWNNDNIYAGFKNLMDWWVSKSKNRHLYIGHAAYKLNLKDKQGYPTSELISQINQTRDKQEIQGNIYFRAEAFRDNYQNFIEKFEETIYKYQSIIPTMPWLDSVPPLEPQNFKKKIILGDFIEMQWQKTKSKNPQDTAHYYIIYQTTFKPNSLEDLGAEHILSIQKSTKYTAIVPKEKTYFSITAVDRLHNESEKFVGFYVEGLK